MPDFGFLANGLQPTTQLENPIDVMSKAMNMKALANQTQLQGVELQQHMQAFNDDQATRKAYANNIKIDPDTGAQSFDRDGMLKDLATTAPHLVPKMQVQLAQNDYERTKLLADQAELAGQALNGVKDQASYEAVRNSPLAISAGSKNWPQQYDPNLVTSMINQALTHKDYLENQLKQQEVQNKAEELAIERKKLFGDMGATPLGSKAPGKSGQAGQLSPQDPAIYLKHMPQADQDAMAKEMAHNQNISDLAPQLINTQNQMIDALKNHDARKFAALKDTYGSQMAVAFKDVEGPARQPAIEHQIATTMPSLKDLVTGGFPQRQQGLKTFLTSGQAAPRSMANGLDLSKFEKTTVDPNLFNKMIKTDSTPAQTLGSGKGDKYMPTQAEAKAELARRQALKQSQASQ